MSTSSKIATPMSGHEEREGQSNPSLGPGMKAARRVSPAWNYLGVLPFFAFAVLFLLLPTAWLMVGRIPGPAGPFHA